MTRRLAASILMFSSLVLAAPYAQDKNEEATRLAEATSAFSEIMGAGDKSIPKTILAKAEGIAVFPSVKKAGLGFGGTFGRGVLSVREGGSWSGPAFLTLAGGSFGLQIGVQATDLVLVIMNRRGLENLVRNQFKVGADASVAAGPVGRDAQAATDIQMRAQILSYSRARGVFAGVSINGTTIKQDKDANERFYRKPLETKQVVFGRLGGSPDPVPAWRETLDKYTK